MATTQELIDTVKALNSNDLDNYYGEDATDEQIVSQINWALRVIGKACYLIDPMIAFTYTAGSMGPYRLDDLEVFSKQIVSLHKVIVNGYALTGRDGKPGCWSLDDFERDYPNWRAAGSGTPSNAVLAGDAVYLVEAPEAGLTLYAVGQVLPPPLSHTELDASPQLPADAHDALGLMAAAIAARPVATEAESWQRLNDYRADAAVSVRAIGMRNYNAVHTTGRSNSSARLLRV